MRSRSGRVRSLVACALTLVGLACANRVAAGSHDIAIVDFEYKPATLTVFVGEPVTWNNGSADTHTVTSDTGSELTSGNLAAGESFGHVFGVPGTYPYHCEIHPTQMKGTIVVQPAPLGSQQSGDVTPAPPEGTLPPNFSPGGSVGPIETAGVAATAVPAPSPSAATQPPTTSDSGLTPVVGLVVAALAGAAIALLLMRGRRRRR